MNRDQGGFRLLGSPEKSCSYILNLKTAAKRKLVVLFGTSLTGGLQ